MPRKLAPDAPGIIVEIQGIVNAIKVASKIDRTRS
jgi:hypothetical protein